MEDKTKATETPIEENKTIGRRELLKALAAGGGAVAASAVVSGKWVKPVVEAGVLPAHAATSALIYFKIFSTPTVTDVAGEDVEDLGEGGLTPSAVKVTVEGSTAYVELNNGTGQWRVEAILNTDGTPVNGLNINGVSGCGGVDTLFDYLWWSVEGYTSGASSITIKNTKIVEGISKVGWTVTSPLVDAGTLPPLLPCDGE